MNFGVDMSSLPVLLDQATDNNKENKEALAVLQQTAMAAGTELQQAKVAAQHARRTYVEARTLMAQKGKSRGFYPVEQQGYPPYANCLRRQLERKAVGGVG